MSKVKVVYSFIYKDGYCGDVTMTSTAEVQYEVTGSTVTWSTDVTDVLQEDVRVALQRELQTTLVATESNEFAIAPRFARCEASEFRVWVAPYTGARVVISPASVVLTLNYLDSVVEINGLQCAYRRIEDVYVDGSGRIYKLHGKWRLQEV